jgi:hypothetical protein
MSVYLTPTKIQTKQVHRFNSFHYVIKTMCSNSNLSIFWNKFLSHNRFFLWKKRVHAWEKGWKKTTRFCRCFLPVTLLINSSPRCQYFFPTGRHSLLDFKYLSNVSQPRHARESFVYCAIDVELLSLQIVEIERHNYLLDHKYSFSRLQNIAPSHEQKVTILPQT